MRRRTRSGHAKRFGRPNHAYAEEHCLALVTRDRDFANTRGYPPERYAGIVVLQWPDYAAARAVAAPLESFAEEASLLARVPGRLAMVEPGKIRFQPA
jgi:hypothetical protein